MLSGNHLCSVLFHFNFMSVPSNPRQKKIIVGMPIRFKASRTYNKIFLMERRQTWSPNEGLERIFFLPFLRRYNQFSPTLQPHSHSVPWSDVQKNFHYFRKFFQFHDFLYFFKLLLSSKQKEIERKIFRVLYLDQASSNVRKTVSQII